MKPSLISSALPKLTLREEQCLQHVLIGRTAKETAKTLGISYRTVEDYLNNLKIKFNCHKKRELLAIVPHSYDPI
ncbi:MAG: helix-turn-helix transcriptional regulator [Gammaproteobacteria bacterium]